MFILKVLGNQWRLLKKKGQKTVLGVIGQKPREVSVRKRGNLSRVSESRHEAVGGPWGVRSGGRGGTYVSPVSCLTVKWRDRVTKSDRWGGGGAKILRSENRGLVMGPVQAGEVTRGGEPSKGGASSLKELCIIQGNGASLISASASGLLVQWVRECGDDCRHRIFTSCFWKPEWRSDFSTCTHGNFPSGEPA